MNRLGGLVAVSVAMFTDAFFYGMVVPLTPSTPAGQVDWAPSLLYGAYALGVAVSTPAFAILTDRTGRRKPLLWGLVFQLAAVLLFAQAASLATLAVARFLQGVASSATWTAGLALIAELFPEGRAYRMGMAMMGNTAGAVLGPVGGGLLLGWGGYLLPFQVAGAMLFLDGLLRLALLHDAPRENTGGLPMSLLTHPVVLANGLVLGLGSAAWSLLEPLVPLHLYRMGATPLVVGVVFSTASVLYGAVSPPVGAAVDRWGSWRVISLGLGGMGVSLALVGFLPGVWGPAAATVLVAVAYAAVMNPSLSELAAVVDRSGTTFYGAVYALYNLTYSLGMIAADAAAGALVAHVPLPVTLGVAALALLACLPLLKMVQPQETV